MKNPQTFVSDVQKTFSENKLISIQKYGCCAFVLLWALGIDCDDYHAIELLSEMIDAKVIESDCTVHWIEAAKFLTGRQITVEFKDIKNLQGLRGRVPVRYDYKGKSHWVGVENGMIVFNSLEYSQCVDKGRPVTARILKLK